MSQKRCWYNYGPINHNQNWVLQGQILPWTLLGCAWSCLVFVKKTTKKYFLYHLKAGISHFYKSRGGSPQKLFFNFFWDTLYTKNVGNGKEMKRHSWNSGSCMGGFCSWQLLGTLYIISISCFLMGNCRVLQHKMPIFFNLLLVLYIFVRKKI